MSFPRQSSARRLAWLLGALCALGCGIAQRVVEEREVGASSGGTSGTGGHAAGGQAGKSPTSGGGASPGSAAAPNNAAGESNEEIGVELDPVPVAHLPLPACGCGKSCAQDSCKIATVPANTSFLMNVFVRQEQAYCIGGERLLSFDSESLAQREMVGDLRSPSRVVADAQFVYFTSYVGLWRLPRDARGATLANGDVAQLLTTLEPWKRRLTELTVDSRHLYWTRPPTSQLPPRLTRTSLSDGKETELARLNDDDWPLGIAVDDTDVYFTSNARLLRIPKAGGDLEELKRIDAQVSYEQLHPMLGIALDARWVYYGSANELRRLNKADGSSTTLFVAGLGDALSGVVVDEYYVYFGTRSGSIYRLAKLEGVAEILVTGESNPLVSAVSHDAVYWVEQELGRVRKLIK